MTPLTSPQAGQPPAARVAFVGAGPGDPGLMTVRCRDLLAEADIVVLDQVGRYAVVEAFARPGVQVIDAGHDHDRPRRAPHGR
jgi:uroporphyrinogen III methyltransferase/synthase